MGRRLQKGRRSQASPSNWSNLMSNDKSGNPGNFSNDREKASEAGQKGGQGSGGNSANDRERSSDTGQKGGQKNSGGNFANDREKASEAGQKGEVERGEEQKVKK